VKKLLLVLLLLGGLWWVFLRDASAPAPAPGVKLAEIPEQTTTFAAPWKEGEFEIRPVVRYRLKARVLSKKRYYLQEISGIAPFDLALGWGDMSDSAVLAHISVEQSGRWYQYYYDGNCPISQSSIAVQSANVHCLPADSTVRRGLGKLRVNSFVDLRGFLVEVQKEGADQPWRSSLVRDDEGAGACEVFWITDVTELTP